ncbi:PAS domain S-box protein [Dermatophilaceae bacterium Sec6.4]
MIETDTAGIVKRWSLGAEELFGYSARDAVGRKVDFIVPEHLREAHWAGFHRAMDEPVIKDLAADLPVLCADGAIRPFPGRLLVLSDGLGTALGAIAIYASEGTTGVHPFG